MQPGLHPTEVVTTEPTIDTLVALSNDKNIVAFGETGLDYFHMDSTDIATQKQRFLHHIHAAIEVKKHL